jgi:arylsulfatase A-like enzyme
VAQQPHVVIIMADQLRFDLVGRQFTPHINALAADSVVFDNAYCASPICVPARGAFFTGQYPNANGSIINPWEKCDYQHGLVRPGTANLYEMMETDWDSWHSGKQHFYLPEKLDKAPHSKTRWQTEKDYGAFLKAAGKRAPGGF